MGIRQEAGRRHEQDVDFHLRRGLVGQDKVHLFKNLKFEVDGETAQIDHLLLHKYGFIIIESKSVYGEVRVNSSGEWSRSYKGDWYGIASPIAQAENQQAILKQVLKANVDHLLGTLLGIRKGFGARKYDILVAISSSAIIHREEMPKDINKSTAKAEFLGSRVKDLVSGYGGILGAANAGFTDTELTAICEFLSGYQQEDVPVKIEENPKQPPEPKEKAAPKPSPAKAKPRATAPKPSTNTTLKPSPSFICKHCSNTKGLSEKRGKWGAYVACPECSKNTPMKEAVPAQTPAVVSSASPDKTQVKPAAKKAAKEVSPSEPPRPAGTVVGWVITCKHCKNTEKLVGKYGKHGYYVSCPECTKNTPMKSQCFKCDSKGTRVRKNKNSYTLSCNKCGDVGVFNSP